MSDTTTTLNPGSGGDVMDESLVTQSDGVTTAKRPRVVIAGDASGTAVVDPVNTTPTTVVYSVPVISGGSVSDTRPNYQIDEIRPLYLTTDGRLRIASSESTSYIDLFGDTAPLATDPHKVCYFGNPWSF